MPCTGNGFCRVLLSPCSFIIYWLPTGPDNVLGFGNAKIKRFGSCPHLDPGIVGETKMLIKSCTAIFLKHISVCAIMHIFMCLPVHSLSSIIAMRWKLSHSLLCVQHPSTWSLEDVKDSSKIFMNKFYARSISEGLFQSAEGNQERLLRGGGSMSSWFNIIMVGWLHY